MFLPPYESLLLHLGVSKADLERPTNKSIPISLKALKLLIQAAVNGSDFNEHSYVDANADISDALKNKTISSALEHYIRYGYFEGRKGGQKVDEAWYLKVNPDVANAVRQRKISSGAEHYWSSGANELRAPNIIAQEDYLNWKISFTQ